MLARTQRSLLVLIAAIGASLAFGAETPLSAQQSASIQVSATVVWTPESPATLSATARRVADRLDALDRRDGEALVTVTDRSGIRFTARRLAATAEARPLPTRQVTVAYLAN